MQNATFRLLTASLLQAMGWTCCGTASYVMVVCCHWCISIRLLFPCTMVSSGVLVFLSQASTLPVFPIFCLAQVFQSLRCTPCRIHRESCKLRHLVQPGRQRLLVVQDRIKEHDRDIQLARTTVSEHAHNTGHKPFWNEVKFIDRNPYCYTGRVKEAIHIRLHTNNINRDSGIEIPEAWTPTIKKHNNRRAVRQRTAEGANR